MTHAVLPDRPSGRRLFKSIHGNFGSFSLKLCKIHRMDCRVPSRIRTFLYSVYTLHAESETARPTFSCDWRWWWWWWWASRSHISHMYSSNMTGYIRWIFKWHQSNWNRIACRRSLLTQANSSLGQRAMCGSGTDKGKARQGTASNLILMMMSVDAKNIRNETQMQRDFDPFMNVWFHCIFALEHHIASVVPSSHSPK